MPTFDRLLAARYVRYRWDRAALIVASIALGVATLVSTRILNRLIELAADQTTTPLAGAADLYVTNGEAGVLRSVADDLRAARLPGVKAVQPFVFDRVNVPALNGRPAVLIGAELDANGLSAGDSLGAAFKQTADLPTLAVQTALGRRPVVLSRRLYDDWKATGTATLALRYGTRTADCFPLGYLEFAANSPLAGLGANLVGMELTQATRLLHPGPPAGVAAVVGGVAAARPPRVSRVDVFLDKSPGTSAEAVRGRVAAVVGDRASVNTPDTQGAATREIIGGVTVGLLLCSAGAMVVGLFLVYNAMSVTVAERRQDIGILRSVGATRPQVIRLFATAAAGLGLVGAALGVPLGAFLADTAIGAFRDELGSVFLNPDLNSSWPTPATVLLAALAGVGTAVLAALVPAVQAASDEPADAVRRGAAGRGGVWRLAHRLTCLVLVFGGLGMILLRDRLPHRLGGFGGMLAALVGLLLAAPIIVTVMVQLVRPVLRRFLPIEARLAADNLTRAPGRTGVVIGALGAGVAVMVQTAGVGRSNEEPVIAWLDERIQADRVAFVGSLTDAASSQAPLDGPTLAGLAAVPGVERVAAARYARPEYNGTVVFLIALDARNFVDATQPRAPSGLPDLGVLREIVGREACVVSDNFARRHGVSVGDVIALPGPNGPVRLPVAGTMRDYSWSRGTVFLDRAVYARLYADDQADLCHVFFKEPAAAGRLEAYAADHGLYLVDKATLRAFFADVVERVYAIAYMQQVVVGVVAALGVVTALLISVLQRKRELGLLLAVGATPGQVIRSVLAEAALMGGFGTVLGVLIGLPLQWYIVRVIQLEESGFAFDVLFPWRAAALIAGGAMGVATLAGLLPALHAVRLRIVDAIAYE